MRTTIRIAVSLMANLLVMAAAGAAAFNYHGTLQDGGKPAEGKYDLDLTLYPTESGGKSIGGPLTLYAVQVHDGSFSAEADFGPLTEPLGDAWLAVKVRPAGSGEFSPLSSRAQVAGSPNGSVCPGAWTLYGNAGNVPGMYLGTADLNPLIVAVNGTVAGQILPTTNAFYTNSPNIIFGSSNNNAGFAYGATVAGGGSSAATCGPLSGAPCINMSSGNFSSVGGGLENTASDFSATVGGGYGNTASGLDAVVGGGEWNTASGLMATVGGGGDYNVASGSNATVSGGSGNSASNTIATISGGGFNSAKGYSATVAGGEYNLAGGDYSFAAGVLAQVRDRSATPGCPLFNCGDYGTFVWADARGAPDNMTPFVSTGPNQFLIRAGGGVGINTNNPTGVSLTIGTDTTNGNGAYVSNGGAWTNGSSRSFKEAFATVDVGATLEKVLTLPVQTWFYKNDREEGRHMGPVAEDFAQTFALGNNEKYIATVDEGGVALAAIQGLYQKVDDENRKLKATNAALQDQLDDVLARLAKLESSNRR